MSHHERNRRTVSRREFVGASLTAIPAVGFSRREDAEVAQSAPKQMVSRIVAHRTLGRTGFRVSDVGYGAGNLSNPGVLAAALERGVNYIDTGEHYEQGGSERTIGEVLKRRGRKGLFITTKLNLSFNQGNSKEAIKDRFAKCLERLQTDAVDCLMIHMCTLAQVKHEPYHEAIRELRADGKVRFSGLSNHGADLSLYGRLDDPMDRVMVAAAEDGRFDVALFVYNYLNTDKGAIALAACKARNMGATLMKMDPAIYIEEDKKILAQIAERYKTQNRPLPEAFNNLSRLSAERATATMEFLNRHKLSGPEQAREAAIAFSLNHPDVHSVCPTINNFDDLDAFLSLSGRKMTTRDKDLLADYAGVTGDLYCRHACGTCEPACPHGVPVSTIMRYDYYFRAKRQEKMALVEYSALRGHDASPCAGCSGPCQQACPYGVPIQGKLLLAHHRLTMP